MIRDFTIDSFNTLIEQLEDIASEGNYEKFKDFFSDSDSRYWIDQLLLEKNIDEVDAYHLQVIESILESKKRISNIYDEVNTINETYANLFADTSDSLIQYNDLIEKMGEIIKMENPVAMALAAKALRKEIKGNNGKQEELLVQMFIDDVIKTPTEVQRKAIENFMEEEVEDLGRDVIKFIDNEALKERRNLCIKAYMKLHPDIEEKILALFDTDKEGVLTKEDILNIEYIVGSSNLVEKELFINTLGRYSLENLKLNKEDLIEGALGAYVGFFIKCAKEIDRVLGIDDNYYSVKYDNGVNFEIIKNDISELIETKSREEFFKELSEKLTKKYRINNMMVSVIFEMYAGISTIFGGVTNNQICGEISNWHTDENGEYDYWYKKDEPTHMQEHEMWAFFFSYKLSSAREALEAMDIYLPNAMIQYDKMSKDMLIEALKNNHYE